MQRPGVRREAGFARGLDRGLLKRGGSGVEFPYPVSPETQSRGALASIAGSLDQRMVSDLHEE